MNPSVNQIVWLLPATYTCHLIEEYYAGPGLPSWFSTHLGATLSNTDFIMINACGLLVMVAFALTFGFNRKNKTLLLGLGTLLFVNGIIHILASILTFSYSPGTITGALLYLPLGIILFRKILPELSESKRMTGILLGISIHVAVSLIAFNI